jgi:hypothetical protein
MSKYKLDLAGMQEVRWEGCGTPPSREYTLFCGKRSENHELDTGLVVHKRMILSRT